MRITPRAPTHPHTHPHIHTPHTAHTVISYVVMYTSVITWYTSFLTALSVRTRPSNSGSASLRPLDVGQDDEEEGDSNGSSTTTAGDCGGQTERSCLRRHSNSTMTTNATSTGSPSSLGTRAPATTASAVEEEFPAASRTPRDGGGALCSCFRRRGLYACACVYNIIFIY